MLACFHIPFIALCGGQLEVNLHDLAFVNTVWYTVVPRQGSCLFLVPHQLCHMGYSHWSFDSYYGQCSWLIVDHIFVSLVWTSSTLPRVMSCATGLFPHSLNYQCGRLEGNLDDLAFVQQPWQVINTLHVKIWITLYCLISFLTCDNL